ncbi:MAG: glycosyltransferase, partial [bacterium]
MSIKIPIEYIAFFNHSGYSNAAINYILALYRSNNYDIKIRPFGNRIDKKSFSKEIYTLFDNLKHKNFSKDRIQIYHCIPTIQKRVQKKNKNIGFATFETYNPPYKWIDVLNKNDALITPSKFNYNIFAHSKLKKPLYYIPHCIDFEVYKDVKPLFKNDKFKFLFMGRWKERKGYKMLVEAFLEEFNEKDEVELYIKTDKIDKAKAYIHKIKKDYKNSKGFASIFFESQIYNEKKVLSYIKSFDCFILPTMGEGFC